MATLNQVLPAKRSWSCGGMNGILTQKEYHIYVTIFLLAILPIIEAQLRTVAGVLNKKECRIMIEF